MVKKMLGVILLLVGLSGVALAIAGAVLLPRLVDEATTSLVESLAQTGDGLDTVLDSLTLARSTLGDVNAALVTVEDNVDLLGQSLNESAPLLDQVSAVASEELPDSIEALQTAIPDLAQVAGTVDDTLLTLNRFRIDQEFLGLQLRYDLGIDYDPSQPFDETVLQLGDSLDGLPGQLRSLRIYINVTRNNLSEISQELFVLADDLNTVNGRLTEAEPLLDDYIRIVTDIGDQTRLLRQQIERQAATMRTMLFVGMIWLACSQLAPLVLGWELLRGKR